MQGIADLLKQQLAPVASSVDALQDNFSKMQITVHEDMKAIGARLESLEERMELTAIRIDKLEVISEQLMQPQPCSPEVTKQMKHLQAQLDDLRNNLL